MKAGGKNGSHFCSCTSRGIASGQSAGQRPKNVSSPLRSGEITTAAVPVFGKAETPPALWRRGVQPRSKTDPVFDLCSAGTSTLRMIGFCFFTYCFGIRHISARPKAPLVYLGVIQRFDRMMNKENGLLRKGQAVILF